MGLETSFEDLSVQLHALRERVVELRTTVIEDRPLKDDAVLVDMLGDAVEELLGWLEEALEGAGSGQQALRQPADLDAARRALAVCQARFNAVEHRYWSDLARYEPVADLVRLSRSRGGEWRAWAGSVRQALAECQDPVYETNGVLMACWQELVERASAGGVSVHARGIGHYHGDGHSRVRD